MGSVLRMRTIVGLLRSLAIYHGQFHRKRALRRFYRSIIIPGDLCFDIGAHLGNRSAAMLSAGARVVALEPQPAFLKFLQKFFASDRMTVLGLGVGATTGCLTLNVSSRHPTVTTFSREWIASVENTPGFRSVEWDETLNVEVTTLDRLIDQYGEPQFCKIDVEGMEAEILFGLNRPLPLLAFEYVPAALSVARACVARLEELARYRYNLVTGETHQFVVEEWVEADILLDMLPAIAAEGRSGDIYARLVANEG